MTLPIRIIPRYRLLMRYDIKLDQYEPYYQFVMNEFVPALHNMGLYMIAVWHTAYGDYPLRQVEFVADSLDTIREIFQSDHWEELEEQLKSYTVRYERKLVRYKDSFQF
ncbi:MAG: hypothetical protein K8L97_27765 [Anaerolineae bacterium]|nr:hypothetical protein [Anaerolineae bacterium]